MISFNKIFKNSLVLAGITLALFFALYFYFALNGTVSVKEYYTYSFFICCFVVLPLYAIYCFLSILIVARSKAKNYKEIEDLMTFKQGFKIGFYTVFFAGVVSLLTIFVFFNTYGEWAQDSLKQGLLDTFTANMSDPKTSKDIVAFRNSEAYKTLNLFTVKNFFGLFSIFLSFYIAISALFSQFLKKRVF
ncbi:DUF4199 domain-containing protein [Algoriella sp.]|uniref:DUF4199 domain-containing protein n=1 Tax=Algoriella sp. TaxID=1872434 RepID=UPI001B14FABE|nr:DUF4199 domain-containing protein [Algoriella sp.]MBO6211682.1 DUF4199 domain-containing protein [Algoriella sp.]